MDDTDPISRSLPLGNELLIVTIPVGNARISRASSRETCPLFDYGKLYHSAAPYDVHYPGSIEQVQAILATSSQDGIPVRVRGSGHTFNGCTLPKGDELLIRTSELDWYRYEAPGTVTVGAGAMVWDIRDLVADSGYELPVYNGGWAGPSLGGYICAGGFGKGSLSDTHGGLWENILSIGIVDMNGKLHCITREDDCFAWLFGSYGQLGIIVEATMKIADKQPSVQLPYPIHSSGTIPRRQVDDPADNDRYDSKQTDLLFWFSLLITRDQESLAWEELLAFCNQYEHCLTPDGGWDGPVLNGEPIGYRYNIRFREFNPPLVFDRQEDFIVMGVMSFLDIDPEPGKTTVLQIEKSFIELATRNQFKLYLQAENIGRNIDYQSYYGDEVHSRFRALKRRFDPDFRLNAGTVFPATIASD